MRRVIVVDPQPKDHDTGTIADTAVGLDANKAANAKAVFITIETAPVRYWIDGTDPTANEGHQVFANQNLYFAGSSMGCKSITQLRMIRSTGNNATYNATFY